MKQPTLLIVSLLVSIPRFTSALRLPIDSHTKLRITPRQNTPFVAPAPATQPAQTPAPPSSIPRPTGAWIIVVILIVIVVLGIAFYFGGRKVIERETRKMRSEFGCSSSGRSSSGTHTGITTTETANTDYTVDWGRNTPNFGLMVPRRGGKPIGLACRSSRSERGGHRYRNDADGNSTITGTTSTASASTPNVEPPPPAVESEAQAQPPG